MSAKKDDLSSDMEAVVRSFESWRESRRKMCRIPDHLWKMAANLSNHYPLNKICRNLGLNWSDLRKKINQFSSNLQVESTECSSFIELKLNGQNPPLPYDHCARCSVELIRPDGTVMRIFSSSETPLNLLELYTTFLKNTR